METEHLLADDGIELVWLRLKRLTSVELARRMLLGRSASSSSRPAELLTRKAEGVASSIGSAINFWNMGNDAPNARVLSRYYAMLQLTIAEQVANTDSDEFLESIQRHTENGHGLATIARDDVTLEPERRYVYGLLGGHFYSYVKSLGLEPKAFCVQKKLKEFPTENVEREKLVSLIDLFRRIPELRDVIKEYTGQEPLTFHVAHSQKNTVLELEHRRSVITKGGSPFAKAPPTGGSKTTYVSIISPDPSATLATLTSIECPLSEFAIETSVGSDKPHVVGKFDHPDGIWWHYFPTYKSNYCGSSWVAPVFGKISEPYLIHFMLLYALSIVVRYLPSLWQRISVGDLNHYGSLIDYYISVVDKVLPPRALGRVTNRRIQLDTPGGLFSPI